MDFIFEKLGKRLSISQVATIFGVDVRFVRKNFKKLGGHKLSSRVYVFFEKEVCSALQG